MKSQSFQHDLNAKEDYTMQSIPQLIEDYRAADFEKRLYLFLECPELRDDFIEIDQTKTNSQATAPADE